MQLFIKLKYIFQELRWYQWYKGLFIFICLLWLPHITAAQISLLFAGFIAINLTSSIVYVCNDLKDMPLDKKHPTKKFRPLVAGKLTPLEAYSLLLMLAGLVFILVGLIGNSWFAGLLILFAVINLFYTFVGKHIRYVDLILLGILLVLRTVAGFVLLGFAPSLSLLITVFTLSLFISSAQRLAELELSGIESRPVLKHYDIGVLRLLMTVMMMVTVVFYFFALAFVGMPLVYTDALYFLLLLYVNEALMSAENAQKWAGNAIGTFFTNKKVLTVAVVFALTVVVILVWFR